MTPSAHKTSRRIRGFTLIEIMVVVAIIGILAAIALPAYQKSVMKGHRIDAQTALSDLSAREEKFFASNNVYSLDAVALGYSSAFPIAITAGSNSYYTLTVKQTTTSDWSALATPTGTQATDACAVYTYNNLAGQGNVNLNGSTNIVQGCWGQ